MSKCMYYPDIFQPYPKGADTAQQAAITDFNKSRIPFYEAVGYLLRERFGFTASIPPAPTIPPALPEQELGDILGAMDPHDRKYFVSVAGLLIAENYVNPSVGIITPRLVNGTVHVVPPRFRPGEAVLAADVAQPKAAAAAPPTQIGRAFVERMVAIVQEYQGNQAMFGAVYESLVEEGTGNSITVYARQVAEVSRQLIRQGVDPRDPQLKHMVADALSAVLGKTIEGRFSATDIDLPDLEEGSAADVVKDNVFALSAIYFSAMLEDLKFFAVADKVVEQFMAGLVPISRGTAGDAMYDYFKGAADRLTEVERRSLYARAFGLAQGSVEEPMPNREFSDLWIRFLSGVNLMNRQSASERLVITNEYVFKNARDLAVNLSLHGYGVAHFAAIELQTLIGDVKKMLSFADVLNAYGVRDYNQLIERVSALYLGGPVNGVRQRTMATTGKNIIQFLGRHAPELSGSNSNVISFLAPVPPPPEAPQPSWTPLQLEVNALRADVDKWLAVNGTPDETVDRFAEPVAVTQQPTIPAMFNGGGGASLDALRDAMAKVGTLAPGQIPAKA